MCWYHDEFNFYGWDIKNWWKKKPDRHQKQCWRQCWVTVWNLLGVVSQTTVRCRFNAVNFLQNSHNTHPIARQLGRSMGCFCEFKVWFMFCTNHCSSVCNMMLYCTALYRHSTVIMVSIGVAFGYVPHHEQFQSWFYPQVIWAFFHTNGMLWLWLM